MISVYIFFCTSHAFAQSESHFYDSILNWALTKALAHPYENNGGKFGVNIIMLSKNDSIISFESIYKTDDRFAIINKEAFLKLINFRCSKYIKPPFELIIPIFFNYAFEDLPYEMITEANKSLNDFKRLNRNISQLPVKVTEPGAIH